MNAVIYKYLDLVAFIAKYEDSIDNVPLEKEEFEEYMLSYRLINNKKNIYVELNSDDFNILVNNLKDSDKLVLSLPKI